MVGFPPFPKNDLLLLRQDLNEVTMQINSPLTLSYRHYHQLSYSYPSKYIFGLQYFGNLTEYFLCFDSEYESRHFGGFRESGFGESDIIYIPESFIFWFTFLHRYKYIPPLQIS